MKTTEVKHWTLSASLKSDLQAPHISIYFPSQDSEWDPQVEGHPVPEITHHAVEEAVAPLARPVPASLAVGAPTHDGLPLPVLAPVRWSPWNGDGSPMAVGSLSTTPLRLAH